MTVKDQAKHWYNIEIKSRDYRDGLLELEGICDANQQYLIVRDWSFINFVPYDKNNWRPANRFLAFEEIKGKTDIKTFAFVRDAIDIWISRGMPDEEAFFQQYLCYITQLMRINRKIYKYEDFCREPAATLSDLCDYLGIEYSESWKNYNAFDKVNGDVQIRGGSRGIRQGKIKLLPRRSIPCNRIVKLNRCLPMKDANDLLGYPPTYFGNNWREKTWFEKLFFYFRRQRNKLTSS